MAENTTDRMLRLLWRHQLGEESGARGPRKKWTLDEVLDTAIAEADEAGSDALDGLSGLSIRRLAEKLGTSAPTLYTYIPGRDELLGLMVDHVMGRVELPAFGGADTAGTDWRDRLRAVSQVTWDEIHRHPWLISAQSHRPMIGPNISVRYEWQLSALEGCGLDDIAMDHAISLVTTHATASARADLDAERLAQNSGISDAQWWEVNAPVLYEVMPEGRFPISGRVGSAVGQEYQAITDQKAVYVFGLETILDGIEQRRTSAGHR
ncbi:MAG TPA: TetR/AcrR family transcriptional regulator C-terminal domain-containing protein [Candidatus Corynebacterium avicola]|uniref:TetR/AcrR family transcriptional regulator C-terminal domain-containing protein n=1 Tax=Candidatus Corynebacterium avicola TaxID=2838527 RepID=A0A9D1UKH6_9CORY|nr:TetR/AcrR family transcriptional regulator C-terminal domain-containing protein [Candidatus Corynebacterium avicola]